MIARLPSPKPPECELPDRLDKHFSLFTKVREVITSLPLYFHTETHISGIIATDLHTLNSVIGATIEEQVVRTLINSDRLGTLIITILL